MPLHQGQGPGLSGYDMGERGGVEAVTLTQSQMPQHNHTATAPGSSTATSKNPSGAAPAFTGSGASYGTAADLAMTPNTIANAGGNQPHPNLQPYLVLNWCIALQGIFPSRN